MNIILKSIRDPKGKESTTRIISYSITILIILLTVSFVFMMFFALTIPTAMLVVYGSLLAHQLTLLGMNKKLEKQND